MTNASFLLRLLLFVELFQNSGAASSLANRWDIQGPEFKHEGLTFQTDFIVSNQNSPDQVEYSLWDGPGCAESAKPLAKDNKYISSKMEVVESSGDEETKKAKISFVVDPNEVGDSSMYKAVGANGGNNVELVFCVRFGVYSTGPASSQDSVEVNFLETIIKLHATLESGFQIEGLESAS